MQPRTSQSGACCLGVSYPICVQFTAEILATWPRKVNHRKLRQFAANAQAMLLLDHQFTEYGTQKRKGEVMRNKHLLLLVALLVAGTTDAAFAQHAHMGGLGQLRGFGGGFTGPAITSFQPNTVLEALVPADRVELQPGQQYPVHPEQYPACSLVSGPLLDCCGGPHARIQDRPKVHGRGKRASQGAGWAISLGPKCRLYIETRLIRSAPPGLNGLIRK